LCFLQIDIVSKRKLKMGRQIFEFECSSCSKLFDINLNTALSGNYRIHCPSCGHIHFRKVVKGQITDVRFTDNTESMIIEDIIPMKSCLHETRRETMKDACTSGAGFLHRLWQEHFSARSV
jgi:DNA-directed RNA polymerase subunit RPC12/RpoP